MISLENDQDYQAVKGAAGKIGRDLLRITDAEFAALYGVTKVEVGINTKVMEAIAHSGNVTALMRVYLWFERVLAHAGGLDGSEGEDEEEADPNPASAGG